MMTDKQFAFLKQLVENFDAALYKRVAGIDGFTAEMMVNRYKKEAANRETSVKRASELIDFFKKYQKANRTEKPKFIRAKFDGRDAETGEPFKVGEMIYYSHVHSGYCRADNY